MPYRIDWLVPRKVLLSTFNGDISKDELHAFIEDSFAHVRNGDKPIYNISNSLAMGRVQVSLKALTDLVKSVSMIGDIGVQIDINHPRTINTFLANVASQVLKIKTYTVTSLDEAIALLKRIDRDLETVTWTMPPPEVLGQTSVLAAEKGA
jgi:hypothetical protein